MNPLDVVVFGSYDVTRHPRVAVLRDGLVEHGHRVSEINHPLGMSTADKVGAAGSLRGTIGLLRRILVAWWSLYREGRRRTAPDLVVVGYLGHFDVHLARFLWPSAHLALDHLVGLADTTRDRGLASGLKYRLLALVDRAALSRADTIVVDTREQLEQLPASATARAVIVPVGATAEWFDAGSPQPPPPLKVCFVGLYTPLHGAPVIGEAIALLADDDRIAFTMVGTGQDLEATKAAAGDAKVDWIEWVPSEALPELVASQHVCLGIFGTTEKAQRVVPTKVYQGLAVGNVVVTSDTPPQRRALGDDAVFVPPGDASALAEQLRELADHPPTAPLRATAEKYRPARVVDPLLRRMTKTTTKTDLAAGPALSPTAWMRFDLVRTELERLEHGRVLEVGPGRGAVAARLVGAGHDYTGVELSDESRSATDELLGALGGTYRLAASLEELGAEERFDVVLAFEVLEHIEDDRAALADWVGRLRPGGRLVVSVPAFQSRFSITDVEVGHHRRYEPDGLRQLAVDIGLVDVFVRTYGFPLGYFMEASRNVLARRAQRSRQEEAPDADELIERTKRSGAWYQPPRSTNRVIQAATLPFRVAQRPVTSRGTGLLLIARAPEQR
jgi:glycosyltransferase involved in cell wall biosynthesis/protein-L-isoaspartate O-methyltransferase